MAKYKWYKRKKLTYTFEAAASGSWNGTIDWGTLVSSPTYTTSATYTLDPGTTSVSSTFTHDDPTWRSTLSVPFTTATTTINEDTVRELTSLVSDQYSNPESAVITVPDHVADTVRYSMGCVVAPPRPVNHRPVG